MSKSIRRLASIPSMFGHVPEWSYRSSVFSNVKWKQSLYPPFSSSSVPIEKHIAFIGRSNVGKSSLFNALCPFMPMKEKARMSKTPGRTQAIHIYEWKEHHLLVDVPGYGYAKAPKNIRHNWNGLMSSYLQESIPMHIWLLLDVRRGIMPMDRGIMDLLDSFHISYGLVCTKMDRLKSTFDPSMYFVELERPFCVPWFHVTSCTKKKGIQELHRSSLYIYEGLSLP